MTVGHNERILDQFTRQAVPFATTAAIRDQQLLERIVQMAGAGADDTVLDVACGPGLLTCAFARVSRHATGIDLVPAMLDQARKEQEGQGLSNLTWRQGDVMRLPYDDGQFSVVASRFAFHHFLEPLVVLKEMRRVCRSGGRVVVADGIPDARKAAAFNAMEKLRDPSHARSLPIEEHQAMFAEVGLGSPRIERGRLEGELEDLLERSFPEVGDADRVRRIFVDSLVDDSIDMGARRQDGRILYGFPIAIFVAQVPGS
ncbi:MAG TPA: methyltransferase domain-containing protein [Candidatus Angelobacter sp.]|nr:methyltransferase domain-containing protein [Candidatus Angelobacter sp.]